MPLQLFHIDAFTDRPFAGNPAAVCLLEQEMEAAWMQAVAQEMNLSETAFLLRGDDGFSLRWFTPEVEVELCGHATWRARTSSGRSITSSRAPSPGSTRRADC